MKIAFLEEGKCIWHLLFQGLRDSDIITSEKLQADGKLGSPLSSSAGRCRDALHDICSRCFQHTKLRAGNQQRRLQSSFVSLKLRPCHTPAPWAPPPLCPALKQRTGTWSMATYLMEKLSSKHMGGMQAHGRAGGVCCAWRWPSWTSLSPVIIWESHKEASTSC